MGSLESYLSYSGYVSIDRFHNQNHPAKHMWAMLVAVERFEKSLYDLIRGLRHHKGNEREYILSSIRECRAEIKGSDTDLKATALMKLIYLEMFGHDMSWASFHVLEVMSSPKYSHKRVGYLGAVQSFRPDTEVLMLATNMLKKDITSANTPTISLPLTALPHIVSPSLALALVADLLPRLGHSNPNIRKKSIVAIYRSALMYPEALRPAWPKIKDMLMDDQEDPSVVSSVINVVCELGWRRPQDLLPLAPRLFDLLVEGGNNWMAIKLIKLFATLIPLEPRLMKKLLPPLINLIQTTPAMSLLYECISGIVYGGILQGSKQSNEQDHVAELCAEKLRGMIVVDGDPNLKYVSLLAFNKIVETYPTLVALHQDVILDCIDDPDLSIRSLALQISSLLIDSGNIEPVVDRLLKQLQDASGVPLHSQNRSRQQREDQRLPSIDSKIEDARQDRDVSQEAEVLPLDYRLSIVRKILEVCARDAYANVNDFHWYITVLMALIEISPSIEMNTSYAGIQLDADEGDAQVITAAIGKALRNVTVRVESIRGFAIQSACSLLESGVQVAKDKAVTSSAAAQYISWIIGEYSNDVPEVRQVLDLLLRTSLDQDIEALCANIQAVPKLLASVLSQLPFEWTPQFQSQVTFLLERTVNFMKGLATHSNLEVQERASGYLELLRVLIQGVEAHDTHSTSYPPILTSALPTLFDSHELGPIAPTAQRRVPAPADIDLNATINEGLSNLLQIPDADGTKGEQGAMVQYYSKSTTAELDIPLEQSLSSGEGTSYQTKDFESGRSLGEVPRSELPNPDRSEDSPFYIGTNSQKLSSMTNALEDVFADANDSQVDIDAIPIMNLEIGESRVHGDEITTPHKPAHVRRVHIAAEESIDEDEKKLENWQSGQLATKAARTRHRATDHQKVLLQVDTSRIEGIGLEMPATSSIVNNGFKPVPQDDVEMARALAGVEQARMELQRATERVQITTDIPAEGAIVKKRKKKKVRPITTSEQSNQGKVRSAEPGVSRRDDPASEVTIKKKVKKNRIPKDS